jgi:Alginate lyase
VLAAAAHADPTTGFTPLTPSFDVQSPYNLSHSARYTDIDGVYHLWVFNTDQPFSQGNTTEPRTEMRFNPDYTSGIHQFEADYLVPTGTSGVCIFQIHTGDSYSTQFGSTTFIAHIEGVDLRHYTDVILAHDIINTWFHLNVIHNMNNHTIQCFINNKLTYTQKDNGAPDFYFKCGVYTEQSGPGTGSHEMQDFIKNLKLWTK